jgi:putative oxidoreductase
MKTAARPRPEASRRGGSCDTPAIRLARLLAVVGYQARFGALLLLLFLIPATYYFHAPWKAATPGEGTQQMIHLLKNLGLLGAMLLIIAAGPGPGSLEARKAD